MRIKVDIQKLRGLIEESGLQCIEVARALGVSKQTFSYRLTGKQDFKPEELEILSRLFGEDKIRECAPDWKGWDYNISGCLRMLRKSFLRLKTAEIAEKMDVPEYRIIWYETTRIPPISFLVRFAVTFHIPCNVLLNVDEDKWQESKHSNLVLDTYEKTPERFTYAIQGRNRHHFRKRRDMMELARNLIFSLDEEDLDPFKELLLEMTEKQKADNRWEAYRDILIRTGARDSNKKKIVKEQ